MADSEAAAPEASAEGTLVAEAEAGSAPEASVDAVKAEAGSAPEASVDAVDAAKTVEPPFASEEWSQPQSGQRASVQFADELQSNYSRTSGELQSNLPFRGSIETANTRGSLYTERASDVSILADLQALQQDPGLSALNFSASSWTEHQCTELNAMLDRFREIDSKVTRLGSSVDEKIKELQEKQLIEMKDALKEAELAQKERLSNMQTELMASIQTEFTKAQEKTEKKLEIIAALEKRVRPIEEDLIPKLQAVEKTVEDLVSKQSEIVSKTLPKWEAELSGKIQKLTTDLANFQDATASRQKELEAHVEAQWSKSCKDFDARLTREVDGLKARLSTNEQLASTLKEESTQTSTKLSNLHVALSDRLEASCLRLQESTSEQVASAATVQTTLREALEAQMKDLEGALKQETFERLRHAEQRARDFEGLNASIVSGQNDLSKKLEAAGTVQSRMIAELGTQLDTKTSKSETQITDIGTRFQRTEEQMATLKSSINNFDERLNNTAKAMSDELKSQSESLQKKIKEEVIDGRSELEASSMKAQDERQELENTLKKELPLLRDEIQALQQVQASSAKADEAATAMAAKLEPVKQAVSNLSQDLDELSRMQEQCEGGILKLEDQLGGIQRKSGPIDDAQKRLLELEWYLSNERSSTVATVSGAGGTGCIACGRGAQWRVASGERTLSPSASQRSWNGSYNRERAGGFADQVSSTPAGVRWSSRAQPQAPMSARPTSASNFRRAGEMQESMATQGSPPVGTAFSAARFQRVGATS